MWFDDCQKFDYLESPLASLRSALPDYNELSVRKCSTYFDGFDFFELALDDVDHLERLTTRCLKPKSSDNEVEEIIDLIQNLGMSAFIKRNTEVYQACCKGLWNIGKKYVPLVMAKDKKELMNNFHLRLKVWTCLYRICSCSGDFSCGVLDCKEKDFVDGLSAVLFGSLMNIAKLNEKRIPCSCVSTSWKALIPTSENSDFASVYYNYFNLNTPSFNVEDAFFKTAFAYILSLPKELYISVFYSLFPAFFEDIPKAGRCLYGFYSKLTSFSPELIENLINCFAQNNSFVSNCELLLKDFATKINNIKDEITVNYFPDEFSSIPLMVEEYRLPPQRGDDKFQLFFRLYVKSLDDSQIGPKLVPLFETFWGQSKVPKVYSFYLMLLAATAEILGTQYVIKQVKSLSGDDICPQECLFLRFLILRRTTSDFQQIFKELKPKIEASSSNFSYFIKAFPLATSTGAAALNSSRTALMFSLIRKEMVRHFSVKDIEVFIKEIRECRFAPIPDFIFELFLKDMNLDKNFVANFFGFHLSLSSIPSIEKCFCIKFVTVEFVESLVEAVIRQDKVLLSNNVTFGYQLALLFSFTPKFMSTSEGKQQFSKLMKCVSRSEVPVINETTEAIKFLDTVLNGRIELCSKVFIKPLFEIIDENVRITLKNNHEFLPIFCGQICEILLSKSLTNSSNAFKGTVNDLPFVFILKSFFETYLIKEELPDKIYHINLLKSMKQLEFPKMLVARNALFITKFKDNLERKLEDLEF